MARLNGTTIRAQLVGELRTFFKHYPEISVSTASQEALNSRRVIGSFMAGSRDIHVATADRLRNWMTEYRRQHPRRYYAA